MVNKENRMVLYPNPASDRVDITAQHIEEIEVYNLLGERIYRIATGRDTVGLDVSHYTNGIYIVHMKWLNNHYYKKLVVQH